MPKKSLYRAENTVLSRLLREMRDAAGLTQAELAKAIKRRQSYISTVENGDRRLDLLQLREYCAACGVSLPTFVKRFEAEV